MHSLRFAIFVSLISAGTALALDYEQDILPIMKGHCWECHSNEKEVKGDLALDDLKTLANGQIGAVGLIRPGQPDKSDFLQRLKLKPDEDDFMPRKGKPLRNSDLHKIEQWIAEGAVLDAANPTEIEIERIEKAKFERAKYTEYFSWTNTEGKIIEARFVALGEEAVKVAMRNGREFVVPLKTLNEESIALAKKLGEP